MCCGRKVEWTNNLADHLLMRDDDTKVPVFHQASFLRCHRDGSQEVRGPPGRPQYRFLMAIADRDLRSQIYNRRLLDEILKTFKLLFLQHDNKVEKWYSQNNENTSSIQLQSTAISTPNPRQVERFHYCRDRLVIFKQVFDESERKKSGR